MANTVKLKRSAVPGKIPLVADLELGELALNTYDGKLYSKKDDGTQSIFQVGQSKYSQVFNGTTSWGSAVGGYYEITILSNTHKIGNPMIQVFEDVSGNLDVVQTDRIRVNSSGDVSIRVTELPDGRFAGKVVIS